jgi:heme exporter protein A
METSPRDGSAVRLRVHGLECRRGERTLFHGVDFMVHPGEIVWIRGANGQGKTTLLRTLAGLSAAEAGEIAWNDISSDHGFVYLAHANALKEDLTVAESLRFLLALAGAATTSQELDLALARFGLASRRHAPVRTLSQGQRRRIALARLAVAATPATWLLDEPFDALDASGIDTLNALLAEHAKLGGSVVLTSHVPLTIADRAPLVVQLDAPVAA